MLAITGSQGFIGKYVAERLPRPQLRLVRSSSELPDDDAVRLLTGDLRDPELFKQMPVRADQLIHLAWQGNPRNASFSMPDQSIAHAAKDGHHQIIAYELAKSGIQVEAELIDCAIQANLLPTLALFKHYAANNPDGHIIFASTGGNMYGPMLGRTAFSETSAPRPLSLYSAVKLEAERALAALAAKYGTRVTVLRIANPYGTLLAENRGQGLIGIAFSKLLAHEPLEVFDPLDTVRDYIHLEDLTAAFLKVIQNPAKPGNVRVFNISSGQGHSIGAVIHLIESISGMQLHYKLKSDAPRLTSSPQMSVLSSEKIRDELGYAPRISLAEGLKRMWLECREQQVTFRAG